MDTFIRGVIKQAHKIARLFPDPIRLWILRTMAEILCFMRKAHLLPFSIYKGLKRYKNIHKGQRCFIVATGPSLTLEDIEKLKNEITISMNSIILSFADTKWRPAYYAIQDLTGFTTLCLHEDADLSGIEGVFVSPEIDSFMRHIGQGDYIKYNVMPYNSNRDQIKKVKDGREYINPSRKKRFSKDISAAVFGWNVGYTCIQIAVYMGFSEIYLLGCDCNYSRGKQKNMVDYQTEIMEREERQWVAINDSVISMHRSAKKYADKQGIKIYNATRGGNLEVYERVDLDKALSLQ
ncbi:MAG: DUF115 domain-containing protein [Oscillospiraceae bacterium]|nr:DUF115 domain-containing protein [Oscillospiraceae bacterium]